MNKKLVLTVAALSAVTAAMMLKPWHTAEAPKQIPAAASIPAAATMAAPMQTPVLKAKSLPGAALVEGVDVIGSVALYSDGSLEYTLALRHLFDHFLGLAGSAEHIPAARNALVRHLQTQTLDPSAERDVLDAFERYMDYLRAAEQVELSSYEAGDLERTFDLLFGLRRSLLGNRLADAFFSDDEAREQVIIAQRRIATDPYMSAAEREQRYEELEQSLPPELQEARRQATVVARLSQDTSALRAAGATEDVIQQMRTQQVGYQAAERLAELDRSRAEWSQRVAAYEHERDALVATVGTQTAEQEMAVQQLRERLFTEHEARRVAALEKVLSSR
uniref:Lipase chaperone n=1 Tax=Pseudomonas sp. 24 TaxID=639284 RepID=C3VIF2_9PSED|nr:Lif [Pseudomonas sp. 24]